MKDIIKFIKEFRFMIFVFVLANVIDVFQTYYFLTNENFNELNILFLNYPELIIPIKILFILFIISLGYNANWILEVNKDNFKSKKLFNYIKYNLNPLKLFTVISVLVIIYNFSLIFNSPLYIIKPPDINYCPFILCSQLDNIYYCKNPNCLDFIIPKNLTFSPEFDSNP